ncbi:MAG: hypothetical protein J6R94_01400 [Agathobacter sp.]|nr:hypothetical protein [Agathobacter sp.]
MNKGKLSSYVIGTMIAIVGIFVVYSIVSTILNKLPNPEIITGDGNYEIRSIGLAVGETYTIDFEEIFAESGIEYSKHSIKDSDFYTVKGDTIQAVKEGVFYVDFRLENRRANIVYEGQVIKVFCYDLANMIPINTVEDLCNMNKDKRGHYILNADLDLSGIENFEPIGNSPAGDEFTGIFINPNNYVINNLTIKTSKEIYNGPYGGCRGGLFGSLDNAYINNVILENVSIDVSDFEGELYGNAGGLVSTAIDSLITDCKVSGQVVGQLYVGGIIGSSHYTTLINNSFQGTIIQQNCDTKETPAAGGLAGYLYGCVKGEDTVSLCVVTNNNIKAQIIAEHIADELIGICFGDCIINNNSDSSTE